jgi:16S rRNA (cytidine1402-2'-O)-methyltransferase
VIVLEGAVPVVEEKLTTEQAVKRAEHYVEKGMSLSEAAKKAAAETGIKKGDIYRQMVKE